MMTNRELDELVATKIMGWYRVENAVINGRNTGPCWWHKSLGDPLKPNAGASAEGFPCYSTCLRDAWLVVKLMRLADWEFTLYISSEGSEACFETPAYNSDERRGRRGLALRFETEEANAICLAALSALDIPLR